MIEGLAHFARDVEGHVEGESTTALFERFEHGAQVDSVHEFHDQEILSVVAEANIVDLDDISMAELGQSLGLGHQELDEPLVLTEVGQYAFDCDRFFEAPARDRLAAEDLSHSADADALK